MKYLSFFFFLLSPIILSQELNCRVDINFESLPVNNRELLADFGNVVQDYMNATRFTNETWDGLKIDCSMTIFFLAAASDVDYSAQVVVVSQRPIYQSDRNSQMLQINDDAWSFKYERGQALYAGQTTFDALTSFLDYYAMIIIGCDWDTWEDKGGNKYFQRAQDIVNLGATSASSAGWQSSSKPYSRWGLVNDLMSEKFSAFRSAIFDYHYGIDIFQKDKLLGQQKIITLVDVLYGMYQKQGAFNSVLIRVFFDAKNGEIIEHLRDYPDLTVFDKLKKIDPSHLAKYEDALP